MPTINDVRVRKLNDRPVASRGEYVLYWCQMFRRLAWNHALDYAIHLAESLQKPLVIYEGLKLHYPWANARIHLFMLEGMRDNAAEAKRVGANYWPFVETPAEPGRGRVRKLAAKAAAVVTDDYPAYIVPAHNRVLAELPMAVHAIDGNSVVPLDLLGPSVSAAAHLRPRLHKQFPICFPYRAQAEPKWSKTVHREVVPPLPPTRLPENLAQFVAELGVDARVKPLPKSPGGRAEGLLVLNDFLKYKLNAYAEGRNQPDDPARNAASRLSPYLRHGYISIEEITLGVLESDGPWTSEKINPKTRNRDDFFCRDPNINGFLDEAITWRDVGYHWHYRRPVASSSISWHTGDRPHFNFDTMDFSPRQRGTLEATLPAWAFASLAKHATDEREHTYTLDEFEAARTHDELWNAAQTELVETGRIHN
ncbi:MAG: deoxyribodipyrimidine photolyase, partial [Gemmataceae bacterium]